MKNTDIYDSLLPDHMKDVIDTLNIEASRLYLSTETRSYGKKVTIVKGFEKGINISKIAKKLKSKCATGGSVKDESIVLQGNQLRKVKEQIKHGLYPSYLENEILYLPFSVLIDLPKLFCIKSLATRFEIGTKLSLKENVRNVIKAARSNEGKTIR